MSLSFSVCLIVTFFCIGSKKEISEAWLGKAKSSANGGLEINISRQKLAAQELKGFILYLFVIA